MSSSIKMQQNIQPYLKNHNYTNSNISKTKETNIQVRPFSSVFSKLALVNDANEVEKERNKVKYLQNELEKQTNLCEYQKSVCSKSQTKIQYKKNLQALIIQTKQEKDEEIKEQKKRNQLLNNKHEEVMTNYYFNTKSKLKTKIKNINEKRNILKDIKENIQQKEREGRKVLKESIIHNHVVSKIVFYGSKMSSKVKKASDNYFKDLSENKMSKTNQGNSNNKVANKDNTTSKVQNSLNRPGTSIGLSNNPSNASNSIPIYKKSNNADGNNIKDTKNNLDLYNNLAKKVNNNDKREHRKNMNSQNSSLNKVNVSNTTTQTRTLHQKRISYAGPREIKDYEKKELDYLKQKEDELKQKINATKKLRYELMYTGKGSTTRTMEENK